MSKSVDLDTFEALDVSIKMNAGELNVGGGAAKLMDATFRFNVPTWEPKVDFRPGKRAMLSVDQPESGFANNGENNWTLRLNDEAPMAVNVKLGAGEAVMKLGTLNLTSVEINQGVGEATLDLLGSPKRSYDVRVSGGVGSLTIRVPKSVGIVADAKGGLGSVEIRGLEKQGGRWINPGHENDPVTIRLDVKGGVGEVNVTAE